MPQKRNEKFLILLPSKGKAKKELDLLYKRRPQQLEKAIEKLTQNPTDFTIKGIEKLSNNNLGQYTIRVSKGDRLFYDVDLPNKKVYLRRVGKHDYYKYL